MENEFDSSWFDLRNYDKLKDLDLLGWHRQISIRNWIEFELFSDEARDEELLEDIMLSNCPELLDDWKKIDDKSLNKSELLAELLLKEESEMKKLLDVLKAPALRWIERIKNKPIIESEDGIGLDGEYERYKAQASNLKYPFNTYSVISTPARSIRFLANDNRLSDVWKCCDYLLEEGEIDRKQSELLDTPFDLLCIE